MVAQVQGHEHLAKEILVWIILQGLHQQGKQPWENLLLPLAVPVDSSYVLLFPVIVGLSFPVKGV